MKKEIVWPKMRKITKMPERTWLSVRNEKMMEKIERWKARFG